MTNTPTRPETMTGPKLIDFPTPDYRDTVKALRNLANNIEAGKYGEVGSCGVVVMGDRMEVFGSGIDSTGPAIALLFSAAAHRFAREIEEHGK